MTLADACHRYCEEVAFGQSSEVDTFKALEHCCRLIGGNSRLVSITADDIALAARARAGETKGKKDPKLISPSTVNRQIIEPMRRLLRRARKVWGVRVDPERIDWTAIKMREPSERVREFIGDEATRFWNAIRPDYAPLCMFLLTRGLRVNAVLDMTKESVDPENLRIRVWIKRKGLTWVPVTEDQMTIITAEMQKSPGKYVWTYERQSGPRKGKRYPITYDAFKRVKATAMKAAGIVDFRIHDMRHDFASKLLRETGNLKLVQDALLHSSIASTTRYAHVQDDDLRGGIGDAFSRNSTGKANSDSVKSLKKSADSV